MGVRGGGRQGDRGGRVGVVRVKGVEISTLKR